MVLIDMLHRSLNVLYMIMFLYGVVMLVNAGSKFNSGSNDEGMKGVLGAAFLVAGPLLIRWMFALFGVNTGMLFLGS
jgi:hypothetical protein